jgi:hypothetical protein
MQPRKIASVGEFIPALTGNHEVRFDIGSGTLAVAASRASARPLERQSSAEFTG